MKIKRLLSAALLIYNNTIISQRYYEPMILGCQYISIFLFSTFILYGSHGGLRRHESRIVFILQKRMAFLHPAAYSDEQNDV
ncbi:MAG: hypothetical protein P4N59_18830 [Negativicutes bacterium]|nr:hypothetical protein [Negativicutes bacterium]